MSFSSSSASSSAVRIGAMTASPPRGSQRTTASSSQSVSDASSHQARASPKTGRATYVIYEMCVGCVMRVCAAYYWPYQQQYVSKMIAGP